MMTKLHRAHALYVSVDGELGERWWVSLDGDLWIRADREPQTTDYDLIVRIVAWTSRVAPRQTYSTDFITAMWGGAAALLDPLNLSDVAS
jgi:hypothetical protein